MIKWVTSSWFFENYKNLKCTGEFEREKKTKSLSDWHYQAIFELDLLVMHFTLRTDITSHSPSFFFLYCQSGWIHFHRTTTRH